MKSRLMIYNCLAGSYLNYGIVAWGAAAPSTLQKLRILQNRIIRYITFLPPRTNVDHKFNTLGILTVDELYFFEVAKLVYTIQKGIAPKIFNDFFPHSSHNYQTRLRQNTSYSLAQPRTERGKRSLLYSGVLFWSLIPVEMKLLSAKPFKRSLKACLLQNGIPQ